MNNLYVNDNQAQEHPLKEKLFTSWKPQHILLMYPTEFEDEHDMTFIEITRSSRLYCATGQFDQIPILQYNISADDALEFTEHEDFVKFWVPPTDVIRLTDDAFWEINQIPTGEIALITEADIDLYNAIIFTDHWLYMIDSNYSDDDDIDSNADDIGSNADDIGSNADDIDSNADDQHLNEIDTTDVMDYHCEETEPFDYEMDTDSEDLVYDSNVSDYSNDSIE